MISFHVRENALALALAAVGCTERNPGDSATATEPASTSSTTSEAPTTGPAPTTSANTGTTGDPVCLEASYHAPEPAPWQLSCGLPELCPGDDPLVFQLGAPELLSPGSVEVDDLERARCMVQALRDRTVGQFSWLAVADSVVFADPLSLEILGDAALSRSRRGVVELIAPDNAYEGLYLLRGPDFFSACKGGDAMALWLCLVDPVVPGCLAGPLPCPE